jgi:hypothetical protein
MIAPTIRRAGASVTCVVDTDQVFAHPEYPPLMDLKLRQDGPTAGTGSVTGYNAQVAGVSLSGQRGCLLHRRATAAGRATGGRQARGYFNSRGVGERAPRTQHRQRLGADG